MRKILEFIVSPGIPYPISAAAHIIAGAILGALLPQLFGVGEDYEASQAAAILGAKVGAVAGGLLGLLLYFILRQSARRPR